MKRYVYFIALIHHVEKKKNEILLFFVISWQ